MAIKDYDGTANHEIKSLRDWDGSAGNPIGKVYDWNGTTNSLIYSAGITVTNLLSSSISNHYGWQSRGTHSNTVTLQNFSTVIGHRYYVRAEWGGYSYTADGGEFWANAKFNGTTVVGVGGVDQAGGHYWPGSSASGHAIIQATSTTTAAQHTWYIRESDQGSSQVNFYMVVDITALEAEFGTMTANQVWEKLGSAVFYGSKEITV